MTTVYAPNRSFKGIRAGGVQFVHGVGLTDNPAALRYFARAGYGIGQPLDAAPVIEIEVPVQAAIPAPDQDEAGEQDEEAPPPQAVPSRPAVRAPVADWRDWAVAQGADPIDAAGTSKEALIARYGG